MQQPLGGGFFIPVTGAGSVIVAGIGHTCMTTGDGRVLCWGLNASGQDGDGSSINRLTPVYVEGLKNVVNLTAGSLHTCALDVEGSVFCWGDNKSGQLGDGSTMNKSIPVAVSLPSKATLINAGQDFTCAVLETGDMYCWGQNGKGQLNDGTTTNQVSPVKSGINPPAIISGGLDLLLGQSAGKVQAWLNAKGTEIGGLNAMDISSNRFAVGGCAVASGSKISCWGPDGAPAEVSGSADEVDVETGLAHGCAVDSANMVGCWGSNTNGELGDGSNTTRGGAAPVKNLGPVFALAVGGHHGCTITSLNSVMCWGQNPYGQLGNGTTSNSNVPVEVTLP
jgi:alpha-tubulin suppressor-like RCC1 family protein